MTQKIMCPKGGSGLICVNPERNITEISTSWQLANYCRYYTPFPYAVKYKKSCVFCRYSMNPKIKPKKEEETDG